LAGDIFVDMILQIKAYKMFLIRIFFMPVYCLMQTLKKQ